MPTEYPVLRWVRITCHEEDLRVRPTIVPRVPPLQAADHLEAYKPFLFETKEAAIASWRADLAAIHNGRLDVRRVLQTEYNIPPQIPDYAGESGDLFNTYRRRERDLLAGRPANDLCICSVQENGAIEMHGRQYYLGPDGKARVSYCDDDFWYEFDRSQLFEMHGLVDEHADELTAAAPAP